MKQPSVLAVVLLYGISAAALASEPKGSDFPIAFVVNAFVYSPGSDCTMRLTAGSTNYDVRWHYNEAQIRGGCPEHRSGEHWQGRIGKGIKGYRIELLGVDRKGKPAVETWYITNQIQ